MGEIPPHTPLPAIHHELARFIERVIHPGQHLRWAAPAQAGQHGVDTGHAPLEEVARPSP
jgi:hypothetical protein